MLSKRYYRFVFGFIMALVMSFIVSGALVFINLGLVDNFIKIWAISWGKAFVLAYPCVVVLAPIAGKITAKICSND